MCVLTPRANGAALGRGDGDPLRYGEARRQAEQVPRHVLLADRHEVQHPGDHDIQLIDVDDGMASCRGSDGLRRGVGHR